MNVLLNRDTPNVLFYSKLCKYCTDILLFYQENNLTNLVTGICIDNRRYTNNGGVEIITANGQVYLLPPNIDSVPTLLVKLKNGSITNVVGDSIKSFYSEYISKQTSTATLGHGEPISSNSHNYTNSSELMSSNSILNNNYASVNNTDTIVCKNETYIPDKIISTIDNIVQQRSDELIDIIPKQQLSI